MAKSQKVKLADIAWCEVRVDGSNRSHIKIVGNNSKGTRIDVVIEAAPTFIVSHIADELAQALVKVRGKVQKDIDCVRQSLD